MGHTKKERLDCRLHKQLPHMSRQHIQAWIMRGAVRVDGRVVTKPGTMIGPDAVLQCDIEEPKFVSRAGFKLEKALDEFGINVTELVVLDAGISTGGFTDCLLQRGAAKVFGVDVGYGQVHEKVRGDPRVVLMERTNLRHLDPAQLGEQVDIVTLDLSFISLLKVLDVVARALKPGGQLVALIKPQFEAERHEIGRGGIVRDDAVRKKIVDRVVEAIEKQGFACQGVVPSPILGGSGNQEFLAYFRLEGASCGP